AGIEPMLGNPQRDVVVTKDDGGVGMQTTGGRLLSAFRIGVSAIPLPHGVLHGSSPRPVHTFRGERLNVLRGTASRPSPGSGTGVRSKTRRLSGNFDFGCDLRIPRRRGHGGFNEPGQREPDAAPSAELRSLRSDGNRPDIGSTVVG